MTPPATLKEAISLLESLMQENRILREEIAILKKGTFGRRTERFDPAQPSLFETDEEEETVPSAVEPSLPERKAKKPGHGRALFPEALPRDVKEYDLPAGDRECPDCGRAMVCIGQDVTERGDILPARMVVRRYVKKKYACPKGHAVRTAAAPPGIVDRARFESSVYAYVATSKYGDHLPLHRLSGIFKRHGVHLAKQTMWDMLVTVDELVAQPVVAQMRREILEAEVLHADETPVTVRREGQKGSFKGYIWDWRTLGNDGREKILTRFTPDRSRDGPTRFLGTWSGTLITDGYSGYNEVIEANGITRAGCWSHARRKVKEAWETGTTQAEQLFRKIQRLFWLERATKRRAESRGLGEAELLELRARVRRDRSRHVMAEIEEEVRALRRQRSTLRKSGLGKALTYLENQRKPLRRFLEDLRIPIHNNDAERDLRHIAIGRRNWMLLASKRGGEVASRLYSLMLSCKRGGVNPEAYLRDVLQRVARTPASEIASLTPWAWKKAQETAPQA